MWHFRQHKYERILIAFWQVGLKIKLHHFLPSTLGWAKMAGAGKIRYSEEDHENSFNNFDLISNHKWF